MILVNEPVESESPAIFIHMGGSKNPCVTRTFDRFSATAAGEGEHPSGLSPNDLFVSSKILRMRWVTRGGVGRATAVITKRIGFELHACGRSAFARSRPAATGGNYESKANNLHAVFECGRVVTGVGGGSGADAGEPAAAATDNAEPAADAGPAGHEPGES